VTESPKMAMRNYTSCLAERSISGKPRGRLMEMNRATMEAPVLNKSVVLRSKGSQYRFNERGTAKSLVICFI